MPADRRLAVIETLAAGWEVEGADVPIRRAFPTRERRRFDPFLLLDDAGPVAFAPGEAVGVPEHRHRGIETVGYLLAGETVHRDSQGAEQALAPGDVQLMTAGAGIRHSELVSDAFRTAGGVLHAVQLWVDLPPGQHDAQPGHRALRARDVPVARAQSATVRVLAGRLGDVRSPLATRTAAAVMHVSVPHGTTAEIDVPEGHTALVYVLSGPRRGQLRVHERGAGVLALADDPELIVLTGEPVRT
ncbi:MAG: pirin family protein [Gaiellales bacterium]